MSLHTIAKTMYPIANADGYARHTLQRGLILTLTLIDGNYGLSLTRKGVKPAAAEVSICRRAFAAPDNAEVMSGKKFGFYFIRLTWARGIFENVTQVDFREKTK